jgi:hypothetical protein
MLEPHLAGRKHQEESKLQNPEPPAHTKLLHTTLKTGGLPHHQMLTPNLIGDPDEQVSKSSNQYSHSYPWDKSA